MATNTTKTIFKDSQVSDAELATKDLREKAQMRGSKLVPFECDIAYAALYPQGFESTCQGFYIRFMFDGKTRELPEFAVNFIKDKIRKKAMSLVDKKTRNATKKQDYLGMEYAG